MAKRFAALATWAANIAGSPYAFAVCMLAIVVWLVAGPPMGYSDTWQLIANTVSTLVTTALVLLIQNTQNRDAKATQLKLDELIRATPEARTNLALEHLEDLSDAELQSERDRVERLAKRVVHEAYQQTGGGLADVDKAAEKP